MNPVCLKTTLAVLLVASFTPAPRAQGQAFTYQGQLREDGLPANGSFTLRFTLYDDAQAGNTVAGPLTVSQLLVEEGLIATMLDFGPGVFTGPDRWLEIAVRRLPDGSYETLAPRQLITKTPQALYADTAGSVPTGTIQSSMLADGAVTASKIAPGAVSQLGSPDGSQPDAVQVSETGLVGIGTADPQAGLDIVQGKRIWTPILRSERFDGQGAFTNLAEVSSIARSSDLLAVAGGFDDAVTLVDVTNDSVPVVVSSIKNGTGNFTRLDGPRAVALSGTLLAVAAYFDDAVTLADVSDPANPVWRSTLVDEVGGFNELAGPTALTLDGDLLVVAAEDDDAVTLINVSAPTSPSLLATIKDGQSGFDELDAASAVAVQGSLLAVGAFDDHAVTLIDISTPTDPVPRAVLKDRAGPYGRLRGVRSLAFSENLLAIAALLDSAVTLVDVSDPTSPILLAELTDGVGEFRSLLGVASVAFANDILAVAAYSDDAVTLVDVSDPRNPRLRAVLANGVGGFHGLRGARSLAFTLSSLAIGSFHDGAVSLVAPDITHIVGLTTDHWVGFGTPHPQAALHVKGNLIVESAERLNLNARQIEVGENASATGSYSTAVGYYTIATGYTATALGANTEAKGDRSIAMGLRTTAEGAASTSMGSDTLASGDASTAIGYRTIASGPFSTAVGHQTIAPSRAETVVGQWNAEYTPRSATGWDLSDRLFVIGNGSNDHSRANALTVLKSGFIRLGSVVEPAYKLELPNISSPTGRARANAWVTYSDGRLKTERRPLPYGLAEVLRLKPHAYAQHGGEWKDGELQVGGDGEPQIGFIAQEVREVVPEAVQQPTDEEREFWSLDYAKLIPVLTRAIQELKAENDALRNEVTRLRALEQRLAAVEAALQ